MLLFAVYSCCYCLVKINIRFVLVTLMLSIYSSIARSGDVPLACTSFGIPIANATTKILAAANFGIRHRYR